MTRIALALLLLGIQSLATPVGGHLSVSAETLSPVEAVRVIDTAEWGDADIEPRMAAEEFVLAMANAKSQAVWAYASEEDQEAFGTEAAVYHAFAETFPVLVEVVEVRFEASRQEGDTSFVDFYLTDKSGHQHRGSMGLWLDDAGGWKMVSCDVQPTSKHIAAL
jgi:hypothetical protein